jgi:RND superfamily putative drug exporter
LNQPSFLFERWPRFAHRHARLVIAVTLAIMVPLGVLWSVAAGEYGAAFSLSGSEAQELFDVLDERFPSNAGDTATVVVKADAGIDNLAVREQVEGLRDELSRLDGVSAVSSPFDGPGAISPDGKIARLSVQYATQTEDEADEQAPALVDLVKDASEPGFQVEAGGALVQLTEREPPGNSEIIGITAAIIILLLAFGSLVAMGLPIMTALLGLSSSFFLVGLASRFVPMPGFAPQFIAMIGIGVGIDYALLIVSRYREEVANGYSSEDATVTAIGTAGRSVFFAGGTVVIALLGLWASGIQAIGWVGTAGALVVAIMVSVSLLALPAFLRIAGPYVDRWRVPGLRVPAADSTAGMGYRWSRFVQRDPWMCLAASLGLLLLLAAPALDLRLGTSDSGNNPESFTTRRAYDLISEGFGPGANAPIVVGAIIDDPTAIAKVEQLPQFLKGLDDVVQVSPPRFNDDKSAAVITVIPGSAPQDQETIDLIHMMRRALASEFEGTGARPLVGGSTALFIDVGEQQATRLPYFLAAVLFLSFLLLMAVFRSLLVPLKAVLMNLLSIGAAFGILVVIFQWGWLAGPLGVTREGPVEAFLPMMLFAVLFGLSMDYEVFLVSRIREEYLKSGDNSESVARGLSVTSRVITAAAAIMVAVFGAFALSDQRVVKEFGIGLGIAILLDATVVRLVLVPSLMQLAGKWNWWMPQRLDRLVPRINVESERQDQRGATPRQAPADTP